MWSDHFIVEVYAGSSMMIVLLAQAGLLSVEADCEFTFLGGPKD